MSEPEKPATDATVQAMLVDLAKRIFGKEAVLAILAVAAVVAATLGGVAAFGQSIQGRVDAGLAPCVEGTKATAAALEEHKRDEAAKMIEVSAGLAQLQRNAIDKEIRDAARFDVLTRTVLSGRPQPETAALSVPAVRTDGGP
jgi:hypothetical protein